MAVFSVVRVVRLVALVRVHSQRRGAGHIQLTISRRTV